MPSKKNFSITVVGGGSWATALVKILSESGSRIHWWVRNSQAANHIKKHGHNPSYLSDVKINLQKTRVTSNLKEAILDSEIIILAVPSAFLSASLYPLRPEHFRSKIIFSAIKGIVPQGLMIVGEFINKHFKIPIENIGVITGPCHAEEVAMEKLSYLTIACQTTNHADRLAGKMNNRYIRCIVSDDIYGTEYAAVLKNIIAIASGMYHALGYGDNFQAVLLSNAIREIKRFVDVVHPISRDINDSAYLGDLLVTCYSQFSRNRTFGSMIGKGYSVNSAQLEMNMVAEGYYAVQCIWQLNRKYKVNIPICEAVYRVLYQNKGARNELKKLAAKLK